MDFRLAYRGPLKATQGDPRVGSRQSTKHRELKHRMRLDFHAQLRHVWSETRFIDNNQKPDGSKAYHIENLARKNKIPPWSFVPLVTHELELLCGIEVLLLRLDHPSHSLWSGDVDNRLKTIIDALRMPHVNDGYADISPEEGQNPLFCLLEDDKLLTRVSVETDKLL